MNSQSALLHNLASKKVSCAGPLEIVNESQYFLLAAHGLASFEDIWAMPEDFVEPINERRGGWGGATVIELDGVNGPQKYFFKRQENQQRYSLKYPFGALTYQYEVDAILKLGPMCSQIVDLVCFGFRKSGRKNQGIVVTRDVQMQALSDLDKPWTNWKSLAPGLKYAGRQLFKFHQTGWSHGSFYPQHIFFENKTGNVRLIDLECARKCLFPQAAIRRDLKQFIKRTEWIPDSAKALLLAPYIEHYPELARKLDIVY